MAPNQSKENPVGPYSQTIFILVPLELFDVTAEITLKQIQLISDLLADIFRKAIQYS